jgi:hypothetical protein
MDTPLHTTAYDERLQAALPNLSKYPQMLPFIGNEWSRMSKRILIIAESHYLPVCSNGKSSSENWYNNDASLLTFEDKNWTDTRSVVNSADHYAITKKNHSRGHSIFYNIKSAVFEAMEISNPKQTVFQHFAYYNYFQRPAEKTGGSILNTHIDDDIAYKTFKALCRIIEPTAVIFVSQKAYKSFKSKYSLESDRIFNHIAIQNIVHPASSWWNRKSSKLSVTGEAETGKDKFTRTLGVYNFQMADIKTVNTLI